MKLLDDIRHHLATLNSGQQQREAAVLLREAATALDKNRWISVSEQLPDSDHPVLVWNSGGDCEKPWAWWQICEYKDGEWREQDERDKYPGVTHWMPLPSEPENWKPLFVPSACP